MVMMLKTELQIKSFGISERGKFEYFLNFGSAGEFGAIVQQGGGRFNVLVTVQFFDFLGGM